MILPLHISRSRPDKSVAMAQWIRKRHLEEWPRLWLFAFWGLFFLLISLGFLQLFPFRLKIFSSLRVYVLFLFFFSFFLWTHSRWFQVNHDNSLKDFLKVIFFLLFSFTLNSSSSSSSLPPSLSLSLSLSPVFFFFYMQQADYFPKETHNKTFR